MSVLIAAEAWGCPPWEIVGGNRLRWWYRWAYWANQRALKQQDDLEGLGG